MIKQSIVWIIAFNLALLASVAASSDSKSINEKIDAIMLPWSELDAPGAAIVVRKGGKTLVSKGYGLANLEYTVPMTDVTPIKIASLSKQFTAFSALILVSSGDLSLDTSIQELFPEIQGLSQPILVRHLLDHTSGLRDESSLSLMAGWQEGDVEQQDQFFELVTQQRGLNFSPGSEFQYNNTNYLLLAKIVERVSGQNFADFTRENIFEPLSMTRTWFADNRSKIVKGRAYSYYPTESGFSKVQMSSEVLGSAGMFTTANDLSLWVENFETKRIGNDLVHSLMSERTHTINGKPAVLARGQEKRDYLGDTIWCHGGRLGGYRSFLIRLPAKKMSITVLSNRADFDMAQMAYDILAIVHPDGTQYAEKPYQGGVIDEQAMLRFTGDFMLFKGLVFSFKGEGGELMFSTNQTDAWILLKQVAENRFILSEQQNTFIEFNEAEHGRATSIDYVISTNGRLNATRITDPRVKPLELNLEVYAGSYWSEELNTQYEVERQGDRLFATHQRLDPIELFASAEDAFDVHSNQFMYTEFVRNEEGAIEGFNMSHAGANDVWFERRR